MARVPRIDVAGIPQHVIQRGNNRTACFFADHDYFYYLQSLRQAAQKCSCCIHAYVLMTNHVHLLVTGSESRAIGRMMQSLGRLYVRYVNNRYKRTGTLWEGRFKSSLIDSDRYLLTCYRYIELNPVRAGLVQTPSAYRWSSYHHNALGEVDLLVRAHKNYLALGLTNRTRRAAYRRLFEQGVDDVDVESIRLHVNQGKVLGSQIFVDRIAGILNRRVSFARAGRPKKVL